MDISSLSTYLTIFQMDKVVVWAENLTTVRALYFLIYNFRLIITFAILFPLIEAIAIDIFFVGPFPLIFVKILQIFFILFNSLIAIGNLLLHNLGHLRVLFCHYLLLTHKTSLHIVGWFLIKLRYFL